MIDAVLERIGVDRDATLAELHRAYVTRVPYENLAIQLGESTPLDAEAALARIGAPGGRGGYCFEMNGALAVLLEELGHEVARHQATVNPPGLINHLALVVGDVICDAGLGEGFVEPLPLVAGEHTIGAFPWTVQRRSDDWWIGAPELVSFPGFEMALETVGLERFDPHHERLSRSPDSSFVKTLVVQRPAADRITTLRARTVTIVGPQHSERRTLDSRDDFAAALDGLFGIDPAVLGPARIDRLWERADAQHSAWLATRHA